MEDTGFDNVARALGSLTTRRLTLGALLGGALGRLGLADAEAKKRKKGKKDKKGKETETTKPWCHCPDGNPTNCVTLELTKKARQRHRQTPLRYPGSLRALHLSSGADRLRLGSATTCRPMRELRSLRHELWGGAGMLQRRL